MDGFLLNFVFENFSNICRENLTFIKTLQGTLHEDQFIFLIISRLILLTMRNVSDNDCRENQNAHFTFTNFFFENHVVYKIM